MQTTATTGALERRGNQACCNGSGEGQAPDSHCPVCTDWGRLQRRVVDDEDAITDAMFEEL